MRAYLKRIEKVGCNGDYLVRQAGADKKTKRCSRRIEISLSGTIRRGNLNPYLLIFAFLVIILFGTLLLWLPVSSSVGEFSTVVDAVFTSTSALCVIGLTIIAVVFCLSLTETLSLKDILFEAFSAFGTVGLSTGITPSLTSGGKLIVALVIFTRANNQLHGKILTRIGADTVVYPELDAGTKLAHLMRARNVVEYVPVASNYSISKITSPQYFAGHKLSELGFGQKADKGINLILLHRDEDIVLNPKMSEVLKAEDVLIVAGKDK